MKVSLKVLEYIRKWSIPTTCPTAPICMWCLLFDVKEDYFVQDLNTFERTSDLKLNWDKCFVIGLNFDRSVHSTECKVFPFSCVLSTFDYKGKGRSYRCSRDLWKKFRLYPKATQGLHSADHDIDIKTGPFEPT